MQEKRSQNIFQGEVSVLCDISRNWQTTFQANGLFLDFSPVRFLHLFCRRRRSLARYHTYINYTINWVQFLIALEANTIHIKLSTTNLFTYTHTCKLAHRHYIDGEQLPK